MTDQTVADEQNEPPPIQGTGQEWFYVDKGARTGPVTASVIESLYHETKIDGDTQVWRKGQKEWIALKDSELAAFSTSEPPPVSGEHVNNAIVWVVALLPLAFGIFEANSHREVPWFVFWICNSGLCMWDERLLKKAGHSAGWQTLFALFLVPVYLFLRAKKLKQWPTYAVIWIIAVIVEGALLQGY